MPDRATIPNSDEWSMICGEIGAGENTPHGLAWTLAERPGPIYLRSGGGSFRAGLAMAEQIHAAGRNVHADYAGSAAVLILVSGRRRTLARNGWLLIHGGWTFAGGGAGRLMEHGEWIARHDAAYAELLAARTRASADQVAEWMAGETILSAAEALAFGFVDALTPAAKLPERPPTDPALAAMRRQFDSARQLSRGRTADQIAHAVAALVLYRAPAFDAVVAGPRPDPWPTTLQVQAAADACARFTDSALDRHQHQGKPLPKEPWTGRWPCLACGRLNYHPPARADGSPGRCVYCSPPSHEDYKQ